MYTYTTPDGSWDRSQIMGDAHKMASSFFKESLQYKTRLGAAISAVWEAAHLEREYDTSITLDTYLDECVSTQRCIQWCADGITTGLHVPGWYDVRDGDRLVDALPEAWRPLNETHSEYSRSACYPVYQSGEIRYEWSVRISGEWETIIATTVPAYQDACLIHQATEQIPVYEVMCAAQQYPDRATLHREMTRPIGAAIQRQVRDHTEAVDAIRQQETSGHGTWQGYGRQQPAYYTDRVEPRQVAPPAGVDITDRVRIRRHVGREQTATHRAAARHQRRRQRSSRRRSSARRSRRRAPAGL